MYCGGERRWRKEIFKEKCMVGWERKRRRRREIFKEKCMVWVGEEEEEEEEEALFLLINRGTVMVEWGYSEEE